MSIAIDQEDTIYLDVQNLRTEYGWREVAKGLNKILKGYIFLILGIAAIAGAIGLTMGKLASKPNDKNTVLLFEIACMVGLGLLFLLCATCYGMIVVGHWKCLKHAPERFGAKWMIFACMTCVLMGPALNITCSMGGVQRQAEFRKGPRGFQLPQFDQTTRYMQLTSSVIGLISIGLFMGFLRAVALCFNHRTHAAHIVVFLSFFGLLWGTSDFLLLSNPGMLARPHILMGICLGWALAFLWYLVLIFLVRYSIIQRLELIKSPLEM
jgi:hypothetical protein